jgi:sialate O-acetylesterase
MDGKRVSMKSFRTQRSAVCCAFLTLALVLPLCVVAYAPAAQAAGTAIAAQQSTPATVKLPAYYSNGMVFQRGKPITVTGELKNITYANIDWSKLSASLSMDDKRYSGRVTSSHEAKFTIQIPKVPANQHPYKLEVQYDGKLLKTLAHVYVGDVFVAAGQSNMEVNYTQYYNTKNLKLDPNASPQGVFKYKDLPETIDDPNVHFIVAQHDAQSTQFPVADENKSSWSEATTQNSKRLSYLAQFFAQELRTASPNIPIGIIQTAWGGTAISRHIKGGDIYKNHIAPLQGFHVAGVLWYQGCNDAANNATALAYESQFTALINQYRKVFDDKELPFLYVQLARWPGYQYTQIVRQAQLSTLDNPNLNNTKNVAMTVSIDTDKGTSETIHPLGKEILAKRMADQWQAMRNKTTVPSGPVVTSAERDEKGNITISFKNGTAQGLQAMKPDYSLNASATKVASPTDEKLEGFEAADASGKFSPATATIRGNQLVVSSDDVDRITQVRYLFSGDPNCSSMLYNKQQLPASPFIIAIP